MQNENQLFTNFKSISSGGEGQKEMEKKKNSNNKDLKKKLSGEFRSHILEVKRVCKTHYTERLQRKLVGNVPVARAMLVKVPDGLGTCGFNLKNPEARMERKHARKMKLN